MNETNRRLLILSCSQRKRSDETPLPAIERYNGPLFKILRKFVREQPSKAYELDVLILSTKYGLIPDDTLISNYDHRMTHVRAEELRPQILEKLEQKLSGGKYQRLLITMGENYLMALNGYEKLIPDNLQVTISSGSYGRQQVKFYEWLYDNIPPSSRSESAQDNIQLRGVKVNYTPDQVFAIAREALAKSVGNPSNYQAWYVQIDDQRVSPKWLVSQLTKLPVSRFHSQEARRVLAQLGIKSYTLKEFSNE